MQDERPHLKSYRDRHGKTRWRYVSSGKIIHLPGQPGDTAFEEAYSAAVEGRQRRQADVVRHPSSAKPKTLGDAWGRVKKTPEWAAYDPATRKKNTMLAETFLASRVVSTNPFLWRDVPVRDLQRRHLKGILAAHSGTPHKAKHLLTAIRKMIYIALDEEWIETDPSYKLKWRPDYRGWKAWTPDAIAKFEKRWPVGTTPRLVYALGLWLGNRRGDIARLRWSQRTTRTIHINGELRRVDGFEIDQGKTGKELFLPITPDLAEVLDATPHIGETIVVTQYGKPFSEKSLTGRMADWTHSAGIGKGFTLHGLRKTLGKRLAEGGASTRQLMEVLGHDDIEHAELYSREAEQIRLATEGKDKVVRLVRRG